MGIYSERLISMDGVNVSKITYVIATIETTINISFKLSLFVFINAINVMLNNIKTFTNLLMNSRGFIIINIIIQNIFKDL